MSGWGEPVVGYTALRNPAITSPNFNLANPTASPSPSWGILQSGLAYFFGLVLSGGTITGPDYIINTSGIFIYSGTPANGNLIGSWAGASGTDAFGNVYPQGLNITLGAISGSTFSGPSFVLNQNGAFFYSGTPGAGSLEFSIAANNGTDAFGNNYIGQVQGADSTFPAAVWYNFIPGVGGDALQYSWINAFGFNNSIVSYPNTVNSSTGGIFMETSVDNSGNEFGTLGIAVPSPAFGDDIAVLSASSGNAAATTTPSWQLSSINADSTTFVDNLNVTNEEVIGVASFSPNYITYGAGSTQQSVTFTSGSGHWVAPVGVTSVTVQCWGAGAGGAGGANSSSGGGEGGGAGAYASSVVTVVPGTSYPYSVGAGGAGGAVNTLGSDGHDTTFNTSSVIAKKGLAATLGSVGLGGTAAASTGTTKHSGGNGGSATGTGGSGGGGSAGSNGSGGNAPNVSGSTGGAGGAAGSGQGHAGGNGGSTGTAGQAGSIPGSGGGGGGDSSSPKAGGAGGNGRVILTWTASNNTSLVATQAGFAGTDGSNDWAEGFTGTIQAFTPGSSPTTVETAHTTTNANSWTGTLKYIMMPDQTVQVNGILTPPAGVAGNSTVNVALPAAYQPASTQYLSCIENTSGNVGLALICQVTTAGAIQVLNSTAGEACRIWGRYSLQL